MREDSTDPIGSINRRGFLGTGAGALAAAATLGDSSSAAAEAPAETKKVADELAKRPLGRTGVQVSMLSLGTWLSPGGERLLRYAWANGIRYIDTAKSYGSEPMIARPGSTECPGPARTCSWLPKTNQILPSSSSPSSTSGSRLCKPITSI